LKNPLWKVGMGTGLGYFICNVPVLFTAKPNSQAVTAALLCVLGMFAAWKTVSPDPEVLNETSKKDPSFGVVLVAFTALVWLDSAAFFIIQNTPSLKAGTWDGTLHLWANGMLHFAAALVSAFLLRCRGLSTVLSAAVILLSIAGFLLHQPGQVALASLLYPVGVSLYSVALVAYPSLLAPATSTHQRALHAGLIYAVAGWFGSAMGIGMGQHLRQVPFPFLLLALLAVLTPSLFRSLREHKRETALVAMALAVALGIHLAWSASASQAKSTLTAEELGRQVYIAEGCINCHSQYVRPNSRDVLMWGPPETLEELRSQHPPLIGNRRQGPDLSQVGGRRSALWLKAHFFNPREVSHASFMPSYAYLFADSTRGEDLVRYLRSLKSPRYAEHIVQEQRWEPAEDVLSSANPNAGAHLYGEYCATCHEATGATRMAWRAQFRRLPPNLEAGPWNYVPVSSSGKERVLRIAQIIKFGIPGSDMPGHEYLPDKEVASISLWLNESMVLPHQIASTELNQERPK
jgi:cbb3-type cytochrome c oxidase subunit II